MSDNKYPYGEGKMRKHISEVRLWRDGFTPDEDYRGDEPPYHKKDFCVLCNYELQGERLYLEIHGPKSWDAKTRQIPSEQPYICMTCAEQFSVRFYDFTAWRKVSWPP